MTGDGTASPIFEFLPALDLRGGRVVRLRQGDFGAETVYGHDPAATARQLVDAGAEWLHVVDLDGARDGIPRQAASIARIVEAAGERAGCQVAGGLRTPEHVARALRAGARRIVVGTAALRDPALVGRLVVRHGSRRIVVAIDVRDGQALGDGWRPGAGAMPAEMALASMADVGVETFAVTAIERDGILEGPDLRLLGGLIAADRGRIIASGGISSIEDLLAVRGIGCGGAIVGRAIYEGRLDLASAIKALAD